MITFGFDLLDYKQRQQEKIDEADHYRLVKEALKAREPGDHIVEQVLAQIGRKLTRLGTSLEERYGIEAQTEHRLQHQSEAGKC